MHLAVFLFAAAASAQLPLENPLTLSLSPSGAYTLRAPDGWALTGSPLRALVNGMWLNASDGSLVLAGAATAAPGADAWGAFNSTTLHWAAATSPSTPLVATTFFLYHSAPLVSFRATFPGGLPALGAGAPPPSVADSDGLLLEFPCFAMDGGGAVGGLGFMQWSGTMLNRKDDAGPYSGPFLAGTPVSPGLASGPLVLFDAEAAHSLVLSPSSNFMGVSAAQSLGGSAVAWGPLGSFAGLPAGWGYDVVARYGPTINGNIMAWGSALLEKHGKARGGSAADFTSTHLGFNTDNGAYYYYNTGAYQNYSVALAAVSDYAKAQGIPYRFVLLDSYWYYKDPPKGGVINWTAQDGPGWFTGGNAGIRALVEYTGWKIIAHNRYWSPNTTYARQNGGDWDFFIDGAGTGTMAVPLDQAFWVWLLTSSAAEWGLTVLEQDWLHNELEGVTALLTNATLGRTWLLQMGAGAEAAGVAVQLCMAYPRHALQSLEMPTATQIRASDDHMPGVDSWTQWNMGFSSLLAAALGLRPFKDNYWSTAMQPGSTRPGPEVTPSLHNAASTLSTGPVTPGDGVGYSDAAQILRACNAGGRLLQPSRALTAVDGVVVRRALGAGAGVGAPPPDSIVSATYTLLGSAWAWDHVLVANLSAPWALTPATLAPTRADGAGAAPPAALAYALNTTSLDLRTLAIAPFDALHPLPLPANGLTDFALWHTAPAFANGWSLLGELGKWVPVAEARFDAPMVMGDGVEVNVRGVAGEAVNVAWVQGAGGAVVVSACVLDAAGRATATVASGVGAGC